MQNETVNVLAIILTVVVVIGGSMIGYPQYSVYQQRLEGEAELAKSLAAKQVAVQAALAKRDSAQMLADAEVIRAAGVAQANKIIGESLHNNEAYLRYLWIQNLESGGNQVIYVPTEASLPVLEAGKRKE